MEVPQEHGEDAVDGREVGQGLVVILEGDHEVLQQIRNVSGVWQCSNGEYVSLLFIENITFTLSVKIFTDNWLKWSFLTNQVLWTKVQIQAETTCLKGPFSSPAQTDIAYMSALDGQFWWMIATFIVIGNI